jgi:GH15 family glucan-1,4-alpha-glucosidase
MQRPPLRCRFVTGSAVAPGWKRWNFPLCADSRPVRFGNCAAKQRQLGSLAFFADCARICVESGGSLRDKHWQLLRRTANYTCGHLHLPESVIWELFVEAHYVAGKVMSRVVLERAAQISRLTGFSEDEELVCWHAVAEATEKGWSQDNNTFV